MLRDDEDVSGPSWMTASVRAFLVGAVLPWIVVGCTAVYIASLEEIDDGLEGLWFVPIVFVLAALSVFFVVPRAGSLLVLLGGAVVSGGLCGLALGFGVGAGMVLSAIPTVLGAVVGTFVHDGWAVANRARQRSRRF